MKQKTFKQLLIAILVAVCSAIVAFFTSCGSTYKSVSTGHSLIVTTDTTHVLHGGNVTLNLPKLP